MCSVLVPHASAKLQNDREAFQPGDMICLTGRLFSFHKSNLVSNNGKDQWGYYGFLREYQHEKDSVGLFLTLQAWKCGILLVSTMSLQTRKCRFLSVSTMGLVDHWVIPVAHITSCSFTGKTHCHRWQCISVYDLTPCEQLSVGYDSTHCHVIFKWLWYNFSDMYISMCGWVCVCVVTIKDWDVQLMSTFDNLLDQIWVKQNLAITWQWCSCKMHCSR